MGTSAFRGNVTLARGDGAGTEVFTVIGEVLITGEFGVTASEIDVTNWDSGNWREMIGGQWDGEEVTIECNSVLNDAQQIALEGDLGKTVNFELAMNDGTTTKTRSFSAVVKSVKDAPSNDDQHKLNIVLKQTGAQTIARV